MSVFAKRLKEARLNAGMSQEKLGIAAGLEEASASTRMNRYELGKRVPAAELVERLAAALNLPVAYFYAADDTQAWLLITYHRLKPAEQAKFIDAVRTLVE